MTYKLFKRNMLSMIDDRIDELLSQQNVAEECVSRYLPEEVRDLTWIERKSMLLGSLNERENGEEIRIRQLLYDISSKRDSMLELVTLRQEIQKIGK